MSPTARSGMQTFLLVLTFGSYAGSQGWFSLLNNFAVEAAGVDGAGMGLIQSVREIPGFLSLLVIYVLFLVSEHRLAALSAVVMGAGIMATGLFPGFGGLAATTLIMSFGFHYYETVNQSLTLQYFGKTEAPLVMGRMRSIGAAATLLASGAMAVLAPFLGWAALFLAAGSVTLACGLWGLTKNPAEAGLPPQRRKMVLRRRYWLYYVLTFLSGARRQIFIAFAVFLLVDRFRYSTSEVAALMLVNNAVNMGANPLIARAVNRYGERAVLSAEYLVLSVALAGYAFLDNALLAGACYVLDNLVFNFALSINSFFQKIADPQDIAPSMAVGFTINHIAAVAVPALGGLVWATGYRYVFLAALGLCLLTLAFTQCMGRELRRAGAGRD